jgi:hypothetical protein
MNVCYAQTKRVVEERGGYMIPFGFEFPEAVQGVADEASTVPPELSASGTVIVCCGSGITLAGLCKGLQGRPARFVGVSCGRTSAKIRACLDRQDIGKNQPIELVEPWMPYREPCFVDCPFPSDAFYDKKAWAYLISNIESMQDPLLYWNVGA